MAKTTGRRLFLIGALVAGGLSVAGGVWASRGPRYVDPSELPYTAAAPSPGSLHAAPFFGTKLRFEDSPAAAFMRAEREDKLVLLLHLSGRFGSSETT